MSDAPETPPPKVDPEPLSLRARPRGITRINRNLLAGVIGLGLLLLAGLVLVALSPPNWRQGATGPELITTDRKPTADGLSKLPSSYDGMVPKPPTVPVLKDVPQLQAPDPATELERTEPVRLSRLASQARESGPFFRLQLKAAPASAAAIDQTAGATTSAGSGRTQDLAVLTAAATERVRASSKAEPPAPMPPTRRASSPS